MMERATAANILTRLIQNYVDSSKHKICVKTQSV